jgi:hypothetical protein
MSREVETSRAETEQHHRRSLRLRCAPLSMTTKVHVGILLPLAFVITALFTSAVVAQELPTPTPSPLEAESPVLSISPVETVTPPPAPGQTPSASPGRSLRISFVPPPLDGKISLGIYDAQGKLVRVLHRAADLKEFKIGADALMTQWDGKNDKGEDLAPGKYHARGYLVGSLQIESVNNSAPPADTTPTIRLQLAPNPLANDRRKSIELTVGCNDKGSFLETVDGLPLFTITEKEGVTRATMKKSGPTSVDIWDERGGPIEQFHVSNLDQMMAFDCGEFELK